MRPAPDPSPARRAAHRKSDDEEIRLLLGHRHPAADVGVDRAQPLDRIRRARALLNTGRAFGAKMAKSVAADIAPHGPGLNWDNYRQIGASHD